MVDFDKEVLYDKYNRLKDYLRKLGRVAVAFSSGVDSAFLLKVAKDVLGDNAIAVTIVSDVFPDREYSESVEFCKTQGIKQIVAKANQFDVEGFKNNPPDRCYLCKKHFFSKILEVTKENDIEYVVEGSNMDDMGDYRPGMVAIKELDVKSPLKEAGLYKSEIRQLSKELNLNTWSKQSFACLATRFVYGEEITSEKLSMVDKAEQLLMDLGFKQLRVRIHGTMARIEVVPDEIERIVQPDIRNKIYTSFKEFGFSYVSLDLEGYRTGSMNEQL